MTDFQLLGLFYRLGDGLAFSPYQATFRSRASAVEFKRAAPGWTVHYERR